VQVPRTVDSDMGFAKLDWRPSDRNAFSFDANVMHWVSPNGIQTQAVLTSGNALGGNGSSTVETRYGKASWTSIVDAQRGERDAVWLVQGPALRPGFVGPVALYRSAGDFARRSAIGAAAAYPRTFPASSGSNSWTTIAGPGALIRSSSRGLLHDGGLDEPAL